MPNQKGRLPITDTSLPKMDFGAHGPHDFRAVGILNHVGPEENPAARCHMNNSIGQQAAPATNIYREGRGCSRNRYHRDLSVDRLVEFIGEIASLLGEWQAAVADAFALTFLATVQVP